MKLAVMQPYLFPYLGYYQLANSCDLFVFYDDVNYIKGGFINRNYLLTNNGVTRFTLPITKQSSFKKINELEFSGDTKKILKMIAQSYSKHPYFDDVYPIVVNIIEQKERLVSKVCASSIIAVFQYLEMDLNWVYSSECDYERCLDPQDRIVKICGSFKADAYINSIGGRNLYDHEGFKRNGIDLLFLNKFQRTYVQQNAKDGFVDNLSIIDLLMSCSKREIKSFLNGYEVC
ncbi:WbqC family protein [Simiduia aestuariiviva]|uniref:WbqC family protein n=1 Tax=Simiduia aestuariiviva TaxID=1510459 RepID=A0A839UKJ3_9GAMM|nr:WbqC family protein [Simiduia aestuariiviva]MBB3168362.1 hypothetical protein [Simiduia aestuariiviva]